MATGSGDENLTSSKFRFFSFGIVTADKKRGDDYVRVWPSEELPDINGKLDDHRREFKSSIPDIHGNVKTHKAVAEAIVVARWIPLSNSNRMSAPDVVKNETVMLFTVADSQEYFWTTIYREPKLRRLETVLYMFGNLAKGLVEWTKKSSYWFEVSTHDKYVHLKTTTSDGEPYEYDVKIDTKEGRIFFKDNIGNFVLLDSPSSNIVINANTFIKIKAPNILLDGIVSTTSDVHVADTIYNGGDVHSGGAHHPAGMCFGAGHPVSASPTPPNVAKSDIANP